MGFAAAGSGISGDFLGNAQIFAWMFRWLVFRLTFLSGSVKLLSHDPTWRRLTALDYHYHTQPIPNFVSWYADQLPRWFQHFSTAMVLAIEIGVPFLIFPPRRIRMFAACCLIGLQVLILVTGNYAFFNWLTIALCIFLFDDQALRRFVPLRRWGPPNGADFASAKAGGVLLHFWCSGRHGCMRLMA